MKTTPLTPNEIRFILAVDATWTVLRQPVLTKIYHDEWAIGNGSFGMGSVSLRYPFGGERTIQQPKQLKKTINN